METFKVNTRVVVLERDPDLTVSGDEQTLTIRQDEDGWHIATDGWDFASLGDLLEALEAAGLDE